MFRVRKGDISYAAALVQIVLLLDADFLPSADLTNLLHNPIYYDRLRRNVAFRQAVVLPGFETTDVGPEGRAVAVVTVGSE